MALRRRLRKRLWLAPVRTGSRKTYRDGYIEGFRDAYEDAIGELEEYASDNDDMFDIDDETWEESENV